MLESLFNKVAGLQFCQIFKNTFFSQSTSSSCIWYKLIHWQTELNDYILRAGSVNQAGCFSNFSNVCTKTNNSKKFIKMKEFRNIFIAKTFSSAKKYIFLWKKNYLPHFRLEHYAKYFPRFSYFYVLSIVTMLVKKNRKYERYFW